MINSNSITFFFVKLHLTLLFRIHGQLLRLYARGIEDQARHNCSEKNEGTSLIN